MSNKMERFAHEQEELDIVQTLTEKKPIVLGHVFKKAKKGVGFNKRYFVLYDGVLLYYKHEREYRNNFAKHFKILKLDGLYLTRCESRLNGAKYSFVLHVPHRFNKRKEMMLALTSRKEMNIWIEMLQTQNVNLLNSSHEEKLPSYIKKLRLEQKEYVERNIVHSDTYQQPSLTVDTGIRRSLSFSELEM